MFNIFSYLISREGLTRSALGLRDPRPSILFKFARDQRGKYSVGKEAVIFYNSTIFWDEFVWGGAWMYYATGNNSYLSLSTNIKMTTHAGAFWGGQDYGVLSWDNKLAGAQVSFVSLGVLV